MLKKCHRGLSGAMEPQKKNRTILVADDEPYVRDVVKTVLQEAGYDVLLADGAHAALSLWERHQARVALLLTDVRMPKMDGLELAARILEREPRVRVLFMSGSDGSACRGFGCLAKPFTGAQLVGRVAAALRA